MTDRHATSAPQRAWTQPSRVTDRRRSIRHPLGATGTITLGDGAADPRQLQVMVLNVSLHGVGFNSPVEFAEGAAHQVRIGAGPLHLSSKFRVISCRTRDDGTWDIGAKFV